MVAASFIGALVYAIAAVFVVYSTFISVKVSNQTSSPGSVHIDNLDKVSVYPREVQLENPNNYRARKREYFRMRRKRRKAREAGAVL
ncbi:hypothetical protein HN51_066017 [Arachis hypogaea]|nr:50S ribosomal protein [Arachis hypogaea]